MYQSYCLSDLLTVGIVHVFWVGLNSIGFAHDHALTSTNYPVCSRMQGGGLHVFFYVEAFQPVHLNSL